MARRLWAFALALVIVGAPMVTTVCQVRCEAHRTHDMAAKAGHAHHSCASAMPTTGTAMTAGPHLCGHPADDTVGLQQSLQALDAPAVVALQGSFVPPPDLVSLATRFSYVEHSPPGTLTLIAQLRV